MFTGLVQAVGRVHAADPSPHGLRLEVDPGSWTHRPLVEASIAVNGCCLTVALPPEQSDGRFVFHAVPETLARTTLASWRPGDAVNLEHAATASTFLGGHIVQGHIDGVAEVLSIQTSPQWRVRLTPLDHALGQYLAPKGSIAVDGVSLTLADISPRPSDPWFEIALIPTTLQRTNLALLRPGARVNLEADTIAKTVVHWLRHFGAGPAR